MSKFDIYTFQFSPIIDDATLPFKDIEEERERIMNNKNQFFEKVLTSDFFIHHDKTLPLIIEYSDKELKIIRIANRKYVTFEREFKKEYRENQPSCLVVIYNNANIQRIAIEQDIDAFTETNVVANIMTKAFNRELKKYDLKIRINKEYNEGEFWNLIQKYKSEVTRLKFEFNYPNLPRVNKYITEAIKNASQSVNSTKSIVEFNADKGETLKNITKNNDIINGLVKASAEGGTPIKFNIKGYKAQRKTGGTTKTIEFDEMSFEGKDIDLLKTILTNPKK